MTPVQVSPSALASLVMEIRFDVLLSFFLFDFSLNCWMNFFENPNPCLMCCLVRNLSGSLGPSGTGEATFHRHVDKYVRHLITHAFCILHQSVANSQKTRRPFQPSALLTLLLLCISLPRYSKQSITFVSANPNPNKTIYFFMFFTLLRKNSPK